MHLLCRSISETVFSHTVKRYMEEDHIMGCSIALLQRGELTLAAHYGYASLQKTPVDDLTLFECASLTKMHFAVMALKFCEDGLFSLDRPVMEQFPVIPWSDDPRFSAITPRHLLSHTSGLPNWASKPMPLLFSPGSRFSYSGEGYYLLQKMIEHLKDQPLDELMTQSVFHPLGMDAFTVWNKSIASRFSVGFDADGNVCKVRDHRRTTGNGPEPNAAWSLYANAHTISRFLTWLINDHAGLGNAMFHEMTHPCVDAGNHISWGLGTGLCAEDPNVIWHWGDNAGFQSLITADFVSGDAMVITTNSSSGLEFCFHILENCTDFCGIPSIRAFLQTAE